jgi:hypothetical protein
MDQVIRGRVDGAGTLVEDRVLHAPAVEQRSLDLPAVALIFGREQEEPFTRTDHRQHRHR